MKTEATEEDTMERVSRLVDAFKASNMPVSIDSEPPPLPGTSGTMEPAPAYESIANTPHGNDGDMDSDITLSIKEQASLNSQEDSESDLSSEIHETYFGSEEQDNARKSTHSVHGTTNRAFVEDDKAVAETEDVEAPEVESAASDASSIPSVSVIVDRKIEERPAVGRSQSLGGHDKKATPLMQFWILIRSEPWVSFQIGKVKKKKREDSHKTLQVWPVFSSIQEGIQKQHGRLWFPGSASH